MQTVEMELWSDWIATCKKKQNWISVQMSGSSPLNVMGYVWIFTTGSVPKCTDNESLHWHGTSAVVEWQVWTSLSISDANGLLTTEPLFLRRLILPASGQVRIQRTCSKACQQHHHDDCTNEHNIAKSMRQSSVVLLRPWNTSYVHAKCCRQWRPD